MCTAAATCAIATWVTAGVASADCSGANVRLGPAEGAPGDTVVLTGSGLGDNCYDTGSRPKGQGDLGRPLTAVEITLVQGDRRWTVAAFDADDRYEATTSFTIPDDIAPGSATVAGRTATGTPVGVLPGQVVVHQPSGRAPAVPTTDPPEQPAQLVSCEQDSTTCTDSVGQSEARPVADIGIAVALLVCVGVIAWRVATRPRG